MATPVRPDMEFISEIMKNGGDSMKKCFQCATCTAVCSLSSTDAPFPRKQMLLAGWGLKDKLAADPSVWYCHQCKDCSVKCPRNAKPADTLAAVRVALIKSLAFPRFMGRLLNEPKFFPMIFLVPIAYILLMLAIAGSLSFPEGKVHYAAWLPHIVLETMFSAAFFIAMAGAVVGGIRFWKAINATSATTGKKMGLIGAFFATFTELLAHSRFRKCDENRNLAWAHLGLFYGFAGLFVVPSFVVLLVIVGALTHQELYPLGILHPLKILGNLAAVALIGGAFMAIFNRFKTSKTTGQGGYADWLFLIVILFEGLSGVATETFRYLNAPGIAYPSYFVHLVFTFVLLIFLPYTKFAHLFYRFIALFHARYTGRDLGEVREG